MGLHHLGASLAFAEQGLLLEDSSLHLGAGEARGHLPADKAGNSRSERKAYGQRGHNAAGGG